MIQCVIIVICFTGCCGFAALRVWGAGQSAVAAGAVMKQLISNHRMPQAAAVQC